MTNLFKYMNAAYERLEKETRDAIQAESHSSAFGDACTEYFGHNFEITHEPERLKELLSSLHKTNVHLLIVRLMSGSHIEDCIKTDKKDLSQQAKSRDELSLALFEDTGNQEEQKPAPTPAKGKNYDQNKKRAERKKRQRTTIVGNSRVEVAKDSDSFKKSAVNSDTSAKRHFAPILDYENATHISQNSIIIEDADIAHCVASCERLDESNVEDNIAVSLTAIGKWIKIDCTDPTDLSKAPDPSSSLPVVSDSEEKPAATIALEDVQDQILSFQYEEHLEDTLENADNHNWTQVGGSRKKSRNSNQTSVNPNISGVFPVKGSPQLAGHARKPQVSGKLVTALEIAPSLTRRTQIFAPLQKRQTSFRPAPTSINFQLSESTKPASISTGPEPSTPKKKSSASVAPMQIAVKKKILVSSASPTAENMKVLRCTDPKQTATERTISVSGDPEPTTAEKTVPVSAITEAMPLQEPGQVPPTIEEVPAYPKPRPDSKSSSIQDYSLPTASSCIPKKRSAKSAPKSAKSKVDILPSLSETATASTPPVVLNTYYNLASSATPTNLKVVASPTTVTFAVSNYCDTEKLALSSLSELIDPGPVPYYQHLKPFKKKVKMSDTSENTFATTTTPLTDTFSLVESLRDAGVEDDALSSLVPRPSALTMSSTHLPLPNVSGSHRSFAGKNLDVRRANNLPTSAGNSPVPPQPEKTPVYHYPPPDVLTTENQEILDLIIKGLPYKKYPRVPKAAGQDEIQSVLTAFVTKKPAITTYDGKDAYEVLGARCPVQLTIKHHPNVNKCIRAGEILHCAYCRIEIPGDAEAEKGIICPGCGPCSEIRYCQRSHLLADSINHFEVCSKKPGPYPLMWSELPIHYQSLYPYIKPLNCTMSAQCFRQMAHCLVINSDGIIEHPFKAYFNTQMPMEDKVKTHNYIKQMYQFQDKGSYYLFHPSPIAGGVDIEITINIPEPTDGYFREDQRFARVRNAAFLTQHPTLLCVLYRRIKDILLNYPGKDGKDSEPIKHMQFFHSQFHEEFPDFNLALVARLGNNYCFQDDWLHVRHLVHDLELGNPILRAWITEDVEDDGVPADPVVRWQGKHWNLVVGSPTFRAGAADRRDWGKGWYGGDDGKWRKQLDRKYLKMVVDELAKVEIEMEGEII